MCVWGGDGAPAQAVRARPGGGRRLCRLAVVPWAPCDPPCPVLGAGDRLGRTAPGSSWLRAEQRAVGMQLGSAVPEC